MNPRNSAISGYGNVAQIVIVASEKEAELEMEGIGQYAINHSNFSM